MRSIGIHDVGAKKRTLRKRRYLLIKLFFGASHVFEVLMDGRVIQNGVVNSGLSR